MKPLTSVPGNEPPKDDPPDPITIAYSPPAGSIRVVAAPAPSSLTGLPLMTAFSTYVPERTFTVPPAATALMPVWSVAKASTPNTLPLTSASCGVAEVLDRTMSPYSIMPSVPPETLDSSSHVSFAQTTAGAASVSVTSLPPMPPT